jgi:16S rRNA (guanine1516-N2)-methyltransferase
MGGEEALLKAVKGRKKGVHKVLDATAGFGADAFLLASRGMEVTMVERDPNLCLLLEDALERGRTISQLKETLGRLCLVPSDHLGFLRNLAPNRFDVVSLDPMFPERKGAALPSKEMQALRQLVGGSSQPEEETELLELALRAASRVVIKRPRKAPPFGGRVARSQMIGRSCRFDIYGR